MAFSNNPRKYNVALCLVLLVLLVQLSYVESRKVSEKSKLASQKSKEQRERCSEKDGTCKTTRQPQIQGHAQSDKGSHPVGQYSPFKSSFARHFINALTLAERLVLDFSREILSKYGGWDRSGWEMNVLEMVVKTISKDIIMILQAMQ